MAKQIVVLNGSPHKNGNTAAMVKAFVDGAKTAGAEVQEFFLEEMNIHTCIGCMKGNSQNAQPCTIKDDMDKIYPAIKQANVIVFASPVYWWNISGQLKTTMDRLLALEEGGENLLRGYDRKAVLLMSATGDEAEFESLGPWWLHYLLKLKWHDIGHIYATGNEKSGDIEGSVELEHANALGQRAATGII